jgi:hypothetical protein
MLKKMIKKGYSIGAVGCNNSNAFKDHEITYFYYYLNRSISALRPFIDSCRSTDSVIFQNAGDKEDEKFLKIRYEEDKNLTYFAKEQHRIFPNWEYGYIIWNKI